jgi:FkbM family methyltransferase
MKNYSQLDQDLIVLKFLPNHPNGFFVDVGAGNGKDLSNTLLLEEVGWKGICIEASKNSFAQLQKNRTCKTVRAAVLDCCTEVTFIECTNKGEDSHLYNGISGLNSGHQIKGHYHTMTTTTLEDILIHYDAPAVIDYLSIDIEGADLCVLRSLPLKRYKFRIISVEHNNVNLSSMVQWAEDNDYFYKKVQWDLIMWHPSMGSCIP